MSIRPVKEITLNNIISVITIKKLCNWWIIMTGDIEHNPYLAHNYKYIVLFSTTVLTDQGASYSPNLI